MSSPGSAMDGEAGLRLTSPGTRRILLAASILVFLVGVQLFVFTEITDRFFAWTIRSPLTAAFLGAAYWASFALEFFASRRPVWAQARVAVPAVLVFTAVTFVISLMHIGQFHLNEPAFMTRFVTWVWLFVYGVVPPVMAVLLYRQVRTAGTEPERGATLSSWFRGLLAVHSALLIPAGVALLVVPSVAQTIWPWTLTPLTGRAVGAWLVGLGIAAAHAVRENDVSRVRVASISYVVFGALELIAVGRYPDEIAWDRPVAWIFLLFVISTVVCGLHGMARDATAGSMADGR